MDVILGLLLLFTFDCLLYAENASMETLFYVIRTVISIR